MDEINIAENKIKVYTLLKSIDREGIDELIEWLNSTDYFTAPASSKYHLNVKGGLVAHSLSVYDTLKYLNLKYKLFEEDSLIVMGLLHDLCKVGYYKENVLKSGKVSEAKPYVVEDIFPVGHGEKSVIMISKFLDLTDEEAVAIRWHMGLYDRAFNQYENNVKAKYPGALLLMFADYLSTLYGEN